jgi:hypothetical protein
MTERTLSTTLTRERERLTERMIVTTPTRERMTERTLPVTLEPMPERIDTDIGDAGTETAGLTPLTTPRLR